MVLVGQSTAVAKNLRARLDEGANAAARSKTLKF